jgi:hypothetical protein
MAPLAGTNNSRLEDQNMDKTKDCCVHVLKKVARESGQTPLDPCDEQLALASQVSRYLIAVGLRSKN